ILDITSTGGGVTTPLLKDTHCYAILGATRNAQTRQYEVALFNPWGHDTDNAAHTGDPSDGIILVSWNEFRHSFYEYTVNEAIPGGARAGSRMLYSDGPGHPMQLN